MGRASASLSLKKSRLFSPSLSFLRSSCSSYQTEVDPHRRPARTHTGHPTLWCSQEAAGTQVQRPVDGALFGPLGSAVG